MENCAKYVVTTHWGTFSLDEASYQDYLAGNLWICWTPGKPQQQKQNVSGYIPPNVTDRAVAQLEDTMLKAFAWYLYLNKDKKIVLTINGTALDYRKYINTDASVEKEILISKIPFKIALIVWNEKITENLA